MAGRLGGELCSALSTAAGKNLAAVGGSHSLSETVNFGSVALLGLIGTNSCHFSTPPVKICSTAAFAAAASLIWRILRKNA